MKKPSPKGGRRNLDDDEAADWNHAARTVEPLKRAKPRVHTFESDDEAPPRPRIKKETEHETRQHAPSPKAPNPEPPPTPVGPTPRAAPPIADFDRKKARKIRAGHIEIEARIDLHGMRQNEAHAALRGFVARAQGRGLRWVLVITGKGKPSDERDTDAPFDMARNRDRGVLKRNVPRWLEEADLRALIISYTTAAISHGGEGALYVHLRKKG